MIYYTAADLGLIRWTNTVAEARSVIRTLLNTRTGRRPHAKDAPGWAVSRHPSRQGIVVVSASRSRDMTVAERAELRAALAWPEAVPASGASTILTDSPDGGRAGVSVDELLVRAAGHGVEVNRRRVVLADTEAASRAAYETACRRWHRVHVEFWDQVDREVTARLARQRAVLPRIEQQITAMVVREMMPRFGLRTMPARGVRAPRRPERPAVVFERLGWEQSDTMVRMSA